jgi:hypothetical protein
MVADTIEVDSEKATAVDDRPRNFVFHPLPQPGFGADQYADGRCIFHAFADQALDGVIALQLAAFPKAAVLKAPHQGIVGMIYLPGIADHVHPHDVVVVKREECLALERRSYWPRWCRKRAEKG